MSVWYWVEIKVFEKNGAEKEIACFGFKTYTKEFTLWTIKKLKKYTYHCHEVIWRYLNSSFASKKEKQSISSKRKENQMSVKKDYLVKGSDYRLSYLKMTGKKVVDIEGYISTEYDEPTFKLCEIVFDDGSRQGVEGEHDFPYLVDYDDKTQELMEEIDKEEENEEVNK